ncbi:response regulator transcription factor [Metabacillus halosaccharovorans]|uniref:response regulator transcription factor n=1 Tax=Metabacillus halosaccharovorans TaxID=930124 RepID=UPI00203B5841|nr:response regulator [Metabacillus halosaccharovorans]MCM3440447.1 response regulator [Metabacillus halosaccharovorans]
MYQVILVDDDSIVVEFLTKMLPWEDLGFTLNGSFHDGSEALKHCKSNMPNVIITDIGMPIMDGITLMKNVRELDSSTHSIILSCHDDFKYAQQALHLGVSEYVLKESMEIESLITILKSLKERLDKEKRSSLESCKLKSLVQDNIVSLKSKFLHTLIEHQLSDELVCEQRAREVGLDLTFQQCIPVISFINHFENTKNEFSSINLLKFSVDNLVSELINKNGKNFCVFYSDSMFIQFYPLSHSKSKGHFKKIEESLMEIHEGLQHYLNISITSLIGDISQNPTRLIEQLKIMINQSDQRFYYKTGSIVREARSQFSNDNLFSYYSEAAQEFKSHIINEDAEGVKISIKKWVAFIREHKFHPSIVREWMIKIVLDIKLKFNTLDNFESTFSVTMTDNIINNIECICELEDALKRIFNKLIKNMNKINELPKKNEIIKAKKYVLLNLDKKITLGEVAAYLHLNPSYFSRLYKQHTNENFIDYVIKSKMERAQELIDHSNASIDKISEMLGFENKSYFFKTFKKYYGATPSEYKYKSTKQLTGN